MRIIHRIAIALLAALPLAAYAQDVTLLPPSGDNQRSTVTQTLGLVKVTIDYSSPRVVRGKDDRRGKIWGTLVPYGTQKTLGYGTCTECPWRGGANENTTFTVSNDVKVEGQMLKAGTYGLHFIPQPDEWTVIFSKDSDSWGSFFYDPAHDALRVKVKPAKSEYHEFLTYEFPDRQLGQATVALKWDELSVPFTITVDDPNALYLAHLRDELRGSRGFDWHNYLLASRFAMQNKLSPAEALQWAKTATYDPNLGVEFFPTLSNLAEAEEANGLTAEAAKTREKAINDPSSSPVELHQYARQLQLAGKSEEAYKAYAANAQRHPNVWPVNVGLARTASGHGNLKDALKYARLALPQAPDPVNKQSLEKMIKDLEAGKPI